MDTPPKQMPSEVQWAAARVRFEKGVTRAIDIAVSLGVGKGTVAMRKKREGWRDPRKKGPIDAIDGKGHQKRDDYVRWVTAREAPAMVKMTEDEEQITAAIAEGGTYKQIGERYGVSIQTVFRWVRVTPERTLTIASARADSAFAMDDEVMGLLRGATTNFELMKAEKIANHARWSIMARNRDTYGDKRSVNVTTAAMPTSSADVDKRLAELLAPRATLPVLQDLTNVSDVVDVASKVVT